MAVEKLSKPVTVRLQNGDEINVANFGLTQRTVRVSKQFAKGDPPTIGHWQSFSKNAAVEYGTITHQMTTDINGDGNPPVVSVAPISIFDQNPTLTFDTFTSRPFSTIDRDNKNFGGYAVPSVNLSGALFDSIVSTTITVQSTTGNPLEKFPTQGKILINNEVISYNGKSTDTLNNIQRAQDGTSEATLTNGDYLRTISTT